MANPKPAVPTMSAEEFEWIRVQGELSRIPIGESGYDKLKRKIEENPVVPLGCLCTAVVLGFGLYNMKTGNRVMSQKMMRLRIFAQGATLISLIVGATFSLENTHKKK